MSERYYLSRQDLADRLQQTLEMFGEEGYRCGGAGMPEPCGGCLDCGMAQTSFYFWEERATANRYQAAGLEYACHTVIDWWAIVTFGGGRAPFHDGFAHMLAGEPGNYDVIGVGDE